MAGKAVCMIAVLICLVLAGCGKTPVVPYVAPASGPAANLRIVTNSEVSGRVFEGCPVQGQLMARAGRFKNDRPNINNPQYPLNPPTLDMARRAFPPLPEYMPPTRMAGGFYREVAAEYVVPAGKPFAMHTVGASAGGGMSTYFVCPRATRVFEFQAGKDYEAVIGIVKVPLTEGGHAVQCLFSVRRLLDAEGVETPLLLPVRPAVTPDPQCKK